MSKPFILIGGRYSVQSSYRAAKERRRRAAAAHWRMENKIAAAREETAAAIEKATVPEREAVALLMRLRRFSYVAIAKHLGCSTSTARNAARRARWKLSKVPRVCGCVCVHDAEIRRLYSVMMESFQGRAL